ncbi:MAG: hypothetical protein AAFR77_00455 [Cyanobacteria bacterium J06631_2]
MSQEQDQEKLINASANAIQNGITTASYLLSMRKPKTKVEIKSARDDVRDSQKSLQEGAKATDIKQSVLKGDTAQNIAKSGGNSKKYADLILKKAKIENLPKPITPPGLSKKIQRQR